MVVYMAELARVVQGYIDEINDVLDGTSNETPMEVSSRVVSVFSDTMPGLGEFRSDDRNMLRALRGRLELFLANGGEFPPARMPQVVVNNAVEVNVLAAGTSIFREIDESSLSEPQKALAKDTICSMEGQAKARDWGALLTSAEKLIGIIKGAKELWPLIQPVTSLLNTFMGQR